MKTIKVDYLARVEGEGALRIRFKGDQVRDVELRIFEPPRFFEAFLRGRSYLEVPDILECIADLARAAGSHHEAARFFGAASGIRHRIGAIRFKVWDVGYEASVAAMRDALSEQDFDSAWAEGAALSTEEAIAYAQRGRG